MTNLIMRTAEPFLLPGGENGVLLVHGFTGTPFEMREMGDALHIAGHTVLGIRLAGHATRVEDLDGLRWQHWLASLEDGICLLNGACRRVFVMGLSLGGILTLLAASRYPIAGAVAMAAPYDLDNNWQAKVAPLLLPFVHKLDKGPGDWRNLDAAKDHVEYAYNPARPAFELLKLLKEMRAGLPAIRVPTLLIYSRNDQTIPPYSGDKVYAALGSSALSAVDKSILWLEDSGHVMTREPERQRVFAATDAFVKRVSGA